MADVNVDPTEQLLAEYDASKANPSQEWIDYETLVDKLAVALRATRTELETTEQRRAMLRGMYEEAEHERDAAWATLQQAQQLARDAKGEVSAWAVVEFLLKDVP